MLYYKNNHTYTLQECMWKHSKEWQKVLFNTITVKISLLSAHRIKMKEVDIQGVFLDVAKDAISIFDKFLVNTKEYKKYSVVDSADQVDITLNQDIDYHVFLKPFEGFFENIEVK